MPVVSTTEALSDRPHREGGADTLIGCVGYRNLRDHSVGPLALDLLRDLDWPPHVDLDDLSYNPVAVVHRMQEVDHRYRRLVLVTAAARGRAPGTISVYRWDAVLPPPEVVQLRVAEAVTGVIDVDNLLVVLGQFEALPPETVVVELEPKVEGHGEELDPEIEAALGDLLEAVRHGALAPAVDHVPAAPLGGPAAD